MESKEGKSAVLTLIERVAISSSCWVCPRARRPMDAPMSSLTGTTIGRPWPHALWCTSPIPIHRGATQQRKSEGIDPRVSGKGIERTSHQLFWMPSLMSSRTVPIRLGIPRTTRSVHQTSQQQCCYDCLIRPGHDQDSARRRCQSQF